MPRDDKDYAIEFGEYLATAAEHFMQAANAASAAHMTEASDDERSDAEIAVSASWKTLSSAIYEFRKRAARAGHEPSAIKFNR